MTTALKHNGYMKAVRKFEKAAEKKTGMNFEELATAGAIAASLTLFIIGRKTLALFVGLVPTVLALRAAGIIEKD